MIVSHAHKFIFLKTRRTAGSSIERKLLPFLGEEDRISGSEVDGTPRRNFPLTLNGHIGWQIALAHGIVTKEQWASYFKFCVERNSYEKVVSDWLYQRDVRHTPKAYTRLRDHVALKAPVDWPRYTYQGYVIVDEVFPFYDVGPRFEEFCHKVLKENVTLDLRLKKTPLRANADVYYKKEPIARAMVYSKFKHEIDHFGYKAPI